MAKALSSANNPSGIVAAAAQLYVPVAVSRRYFPP